MAYSTTFFWKLDKVAHELYMVDATDGMAYSTTFFWKLDKVAHELYMVDATDGMAYSTTFFWKLDKVAHELYMVDATDFVSGFQVENIESKRWMRGQTFLAGSLDPTDGNTPWSLTSHGVAEKLFTVDKDGEIVTQVARSATKVSEFAWEVMIKSGYKFSDGSTVDAEHVAKALMDQNRKNSNAQSTLGNMTVTALDNLTVKIESERPTHVMDAVLAEWPFVVYLTKSSGEFIFTGPFVVDSFGPDQIDLVPNEFYPGATDRSPVSIKKFASGDALAHAVEKKEVDIGFHLPVHTLPDLRRVDGTVIKSFEVGYHYMVFYNTDTLWDVRVRKAIDTAIDRNALSQAIAGGHGTRSLFPDNSPFFSDDSDPHGDLGSANELLDAAGWTLNANGKRLKDGVELTVRLVAYPHRPDLLIMQPVLEETLIALGINVESIVTGEDWDETQTIIDERKFDMLMWAQHTLPAGDPLWFLNSFFRSDGGNNLANIASTDVDSRLDELTLVEDHSERVLLTQATQKAIHDLVPVSNLVTPFWHVSLNERVSGYEPWGSDYYVIRADLKIVRETEVSSSTGIGVGIIGMAVSVTMISVLSSFL
ncbi:oligopeptide-binding protein OppA [Nitzschia inconspicua]|uniref:Oligopeptide-binding protein OppA n=1 Tax=Nitzschia inconspicua TaxID=303405 RepID=A0A9K3LSD1_9STRA|nr:oligopeptide-binding protein OppA [Nitzschia inconspicua]KAG7365656.1 oligopeptide-binding protein OppA [Nitzschia inconspicua]